jgi:hypothetical protein
MLRDLASGRPRHNRANDLARHDDALDAWLDEDSIDASGL